MLHSNWTSYIVLHHFIIHRFNSRSSNSWQRRPFLLSFGFCVDVFFLNTIQYTFYVSWLREHFHLEDIKV